MPYFTYLRIKRYKYSNIISLFGLTLFTLLLICSIGAHAGMPVGEVYIYNVGNEKFSVVWEVDTPAIDCGVEVYKDNDASSPEPLTGYQIIPWGVSADPSIAKARGLMQVDIEDISYDPIDTIHTFYIRTYSEDTNNEKYYYPDFGNLIPVKIGPFLQATPPTNGELHLVLYQDSLDVANMLNDGVVAIVEVEGANYYISSGMNGWPASFGTPPDLGYYAVIVEFDKIRTIAANIFWDWTSDPQNHNIKIIALSGKVSGASVGQRTIETTYPAQLITDGPSMGYYPCISDYNVNDLDGCTLYTGNQLILKTSQPTDLILPSPDIDDPLNPGTPAYYDSSLPLQICAYSDSERTFSLSGEPDGMVITKLDPNCAQITWPSIPATGAFFSKIQVTVSDATGQSSAYFTIIIRNRPPTKPTVSIAPASLPADTTKDLICTVTEGSVINPDTGQTTYIDYRWYKESDIVNPVHEDIGKTGTGQYQSTLSNSKTDRGEKYYCVVRARDDDGSSDPAQTSSIEILNSPAAKPDTVVIAPGDAENPKTDQNLTCTASYTTTTPDIDGDTVNYKFNWTTTGGKSYSSTGGTDGFITSNSHELPSAETDKGDAWSCTVIAWDGVGTAPSANDNNSRQSSVVNIRNTPPNTPASASIGPSATTDTTQNLTCTVTPATPTDADDGDVAGIQYEFTWSCTGTACGGENPVVNLREAGIITDILDETHTTKNQSWTCQVRAYDGSEYSPGSVTTTPVNIINTAPTGLSAHVVPDPDAGTNQDLVCTATGLIDPDDAEGADTIQYKYDWKELSGTGKEVAGNFEASKTTDTLPAAGNTAQGEIWQCTVTAKDSDEAQITADSNEVNIVNQPPIITTDPSGTQQAWDEMGHFEIQVIAYDPDDNNLTYTIDPNYTDPNDLDWITFDPSSTPPVLTGDPPIDSSSLDFDFGTGILKFNFIVTDDGSPNKTAEHLTTVKIQPPATVVENFEYMDRPESQRTLSANGWFTVQGTGQMLRNTVIPSDPNSDHYLQTKLKTTPVNNSQLNYIISKAVTFNQFTYQYPKINFFVKDKNRYQFDVYVRARNLAGEETNYFLQYTPEDPKDTYTVSGKYVKYRIGSEYIDSNGQEVTRNMEEDLFNATGNFHYLSLKGIILRGDIDYLDNIKVSAAAPAQPPKDVMNLTAQGNDGQVTLNWELDPSQSENIGAYNIYMKTGTPPTKADPKIASVSSTAISYTKTGLTNGTTYYFLVTAIGNELIPSETNGKTVSATPQTTTPLPPVNLTATGQDRAVQLTWNNPPGQHQDLAGYKVYYCDCVSGGCDACVSETVPASAADSTGLFVKTITKDADSQSLTYGQLYDFTVKAVDTSGNLSDGMSVSILLEEPPTKGIDDFDTGYAPGDTLLQNGWFRLQGNGSFTLKPGDDGRYLEMKSSSSPLEYFMITKWLKNSTEFDSPKFSIKIRSQGRFRFDLYVRGTDNSNSFISFVGNPDSTEDKFLRIEQGRWYVNQLGWKEKKGQWVTLKFDLDDYLPSNVGFKYLLGIILRGTLDVDRIELGQGVDDVKQLTARPGNETVLLSWTIADSSKIDEWQIYWDTNLVIVLTDPNSIRISPDKNDYQYLLTGLTNDAAEPYQFTVKQVVNDEESDGVSVYATPRAFKEGAHTFDDSTALDNWALGESVSGVTVTFDVVYDPDVQSNVMRLDPDSEYPDRFYVSANPGISDVKGMSCMIKASSNFVIWVDLIDTLGLPFMVGFVPGGTKDSYLRFGNFAYYYLGTGFMDGNWHVLDLDLDNIVNTIFTGVGADNVESIFLGGKIHVDDIQFY